MNYKCEDCDTIFSEINCRCEDWRDSKRAFGCPNCGTFYTQVPGKDRSESWIDGLFACGILLPAVFLLANSVRNGDGYAMFLCGIVIFAALIVTTLLGNKRLGTMEKTGYRATLESNDAATGT